MSILLALVTGAPAAWATSAEGGCLRVLSDLKAGEIPPPDAFAETDCPANLPAAAFAYDRAAGAARVARALVAGEIVRRYPDFASGAVRPGEKLNLVVASGPVLVERDVAALQAARSGQALFVKSQDGEIFSALYERAKP